MRKAMFAALHKDLQHHIAVFTGGETVLQQIKITAHQRKQIGRFGVRVMPNGKMAASFQIALFNQIAVGKQIRQGFLVAFNAHLIGGQHIWPIEKIADASKTISLALGAINPVGEKQSH